MGFTPAALFCRRFLPLSRIEREASRFLKARFKVIEVDLGGSALDVDDETTYRTMSLLFKEWRAFVDPFDKPVRSPYPAKVNV